MELQTDLLNGFATAIGIGLLVGTVREKLHTPQTLTSGIRTHTLLALICSAATAHSCNNQPSHRSACARSRAACRLLCACIYRAALSCNEAATLCNQLESDGT